MRPVAGESIFETLERAGNSGIPITFLIRADATSGSSRGWLATWRIARPTGLRWQAAAAVLRATTATLLLGHGGLALARKPPLVDHIAGLGLPSRSILAMGWLDVALAAIIVMRPIQGILAFVVVWKVGSEALYPLTGAPFWEFVERFGSYVAPLALWTMLRRPIPALVASHTSSRRRSSTTASVILLIIGWSGLAAAGARIARAQSVTAGFAPASNPALVALVPRVVPAGSARLASAAPLSPPATAPPLPFAPPAAPAFVAVPAPTPTAAPVLPAAAAASAVLQDPEVVRAITAARRGGTVIVCRHAITGSQRETEPVDYSDPSSQRLLSDRGERQSEAIGLALRRLGIDMTEVIASPMQRARRTAELMFGRPPVIDSIWHTNDGNYGGVPRDRRAAVLATPVADGNRVIISHIVTMTSVLPEAEGRVGEGDCVVVQPTGDGYEVIGVVPWTAWEHGINSEGF